MAQTPLNGVKACLFDAYGTLFDFASAARICEEIPRDAADRLTALCGGTSNCNTLGCGPPRIGTPISGR
jgi:hypothetical protein